MTLLQRTTVALAAVTALAAMPAQEARADMLSSAGSPTITRLGGGLFHWDYAVIPSNRQNMSTGDFFVIYDFGTATSVLVPAGWSVSSSAVNPTIVTIDRGTVTPTQSNTLIWTLTLPDGPSTGNQKAQTAPEAFSLASTSASPAVDAFVGDGSSPQISLSEVNAQVAVANPEPATLVLLGTGMLGVAGFARRRKK